MRKFMLLVTVLLVGILCLNSFVLAGPIDNKKAFGNSPPEAPDINGPIKIKNGEPTEYTFVAVDPDNDDICYQIDWKDGEISNWTEWYPSNIEIVRIHTYWEKSTYLIRARAKDVYGQIGPWGVIHFGVSKNSQQSSLILSNNKEKNIVKPLDIINFYNDTTPPVVVFNWTAKGNFIIGWYITITIECYDNESGLDLIEYYLNKGLWATIEGPGPVYEFVWEFKWKVAKTLQIGVIAVDRAGNCAYETFNCSDIGPYSNTMEQKADYSYFNIFPNRFVLFKRLFGSLL